MVISAGRQWASSIACWSGFSSRISSTQRRISASPSGSPCRISAFPSCSAASNSGSPPIGAAAAWARRPRLTASSIGPQTIEPVTASVSMRAASSGARGSIRAASPISRIFAAVAGPAPHVDAAAEMAGRRPQQRIRDPGQRALQQRDRAAGASRQLPGLDRPQAPACPGVAVRCELGRPLERDRSRRIARAVARVPRRRVELVGDILVGPDRRGREMPGAPHGRVLVAIVHERARQRAVGGAPVAGGRAVVDGRAHERMAELEREAVDVDEPGRLRGLERARVQSARRQGPQQRVHGPRAARSRDQQRAARRVRKRLEARQERALGPRADPQRVIERLPAAQLACRQQRRDLDQRQRVAARHAQQLLGHVRRHTHRQQLERRLAPEPLHAQHRQARRVELPRPQREEHPHRLVADTSRGESHRLGRRGVQPVHVVDDRQHRPFLRRTGEQAQRRGVDREPVAAGRRPERHRPGESRRLWRRKLRQMDEQRAQQLEQAGEGDLRLRRHAPRGEHRHIRRLRRRVTEQDALAGTRLPLERERLPVACTHVLDQLELTGFEVSTHEHTTIVFPRRSSVVLLMRSRPFEATIWA